MRIAIGSDHFAFDLKEQVKTYLVKLGHEPIDMGCYSRDPVDYPDIGEAVALAVARGEFQRAVLLCGTGIGMAMVANKVPGVRAAVCHDPYSAERARASNDAQICCLGSQVIGPGMAEKLIEIWLASEFQGGRSLPKVEKIKQMDVRYR